MLQGVYRYHQIIPQLPPGIGTSTQLNLIKFTNFLHNPVSVFQGLEFTGFFTYSSSKMITHRAFFSHVSQFHIYFHILTKVSQIKTMGLTAFFTCFSISHVFSQCQFPKKLDFTILQLNSQGCCQPRLISQNFHRFWPSSECQTFIVSLPDANTRGSVENEKVCVNPSCRARVSTNFRVLPNSLECLHHAM